MRTGVTCMDKNSVIEENLFKAVIDQFSTTETYAKTAEAMYNAEREFKALIADDKALLQKYFDLESFVNVNHLQYESVCFCEGLRLGFKLCMDIFNL